MKLLIIGASGLVGGALLNEAQKRGHQALGTYLHYSIDGLCKLDYGDKSEIEKILDDFSPQFILCPAGKTNVDWIEQNPQEAWEINVAKLSVLFKASARKEIPVAFFSSDYIFDGRNGPYTEEAIPNPVNFYGKHKLVGEVMLDTLLPEKNLIFRTTWVFGQEQQRKNFIYSIIKNLNSKIEMKVPEDIIATPTYAFDIAKCSLDMVEKGMRGVFNLSCGECISRFNLAKSIANIFELDSSLLKPVQCSAMNLPAKRPLKAGLKNEKVTLLVGFKWTPLDIALQETRALIKKVRTDIPSTQAGYESSSKNHLDSKICIFIPCYNAATTLPKVFERIPHEIKNKVQEVFVVDNDSTDYTYLLAVGYREKNSDIKNLQVLKNVQNFGYGGSQKIAYAYAIEKGYDMVVMLHGDAQYAPEKLPIMIKKMEQDKSIDLLFGSRMKGDPLKGGMPLHRFLGNKALTFIQNCLLGTKISEFHSGYRIFRTRALKEVPFHLCSNDYHFDTEIIIQFINNKLNISEIGIDTHYGKEKNYVKIWEYGFNVLVTTLCYFLHTQGIRDYKLYQDSLKADTSKIFQEFKTEIH